MSNLYNALAKTNAFKKYKIDDLLFAEYKCYDEGISSEIWTHNNFFSFIIRGKMLWRTSDTEILVKKGDAFFVKKGAIKVQTFYKEDFCELIVFVPDEFIKEVINKHKISFALGKSTTKSRSIFPLHSEDVLTAYFESLYSYFIQSKQPSESLLKLKFEELIINIISNDKNLPVINHFKYICECSKISLREIMEANFTSNLSLAEFASLCGRSLSTFKRDFFEIYDTSPGTWLMKKRLEYARYLLETTDKSIYEIIFDTGFKNRTHFIRIFKDEYGITPNRFKNTVKTVK
jgi:AraC-like DNA-binding protein